MRAQLPVALREKYSLVHVPSRHRVVRWCERATALIAEGLPPEHAGMRAAAEVFPYEARERPVAGAARVGDLLNLATDRDTLET